VSWRRSWENPFPQYRLGVGSLAIVEEMDSLAQAVIRDQPTRWEQSDWGC
jgi:hypothetical protein